MDSNDNNDDFLGEDIDEIFNSHFDGNKKKKDEGSNKTFIIDDDSIEVDKDILEDEDDIYVLEDPGIEVHSIKKPVEKPEKRNVSEEDNGNLSSFDKEDDFKLLEKEFDSVGNEKHTTDIINNKSAELEFEKHSDLKDDDPLDLEDEFLNMKPPAEMKKEDEDLDEFVVESHQYSIDDKTPPPIPPVSMDGEEFVLDSEPGEDNSQISGNSEYSSSVLEGGNEDSFTLENIADDKEQKKTDGRFFDSKGMPVNDVDILKSESPKLKKKKIDSSEDTPPQSLKRALDRVENNYSSPMVAMKQNNPLFEKKNLIIGGSVIIIIIIAVIFFILPTFFSNSTAVQKDKLIVPAKKDNLLVKKNEAKKKKKISDQEKFNKLFSSAKKSFDNGNYFEAKEICRQARSIKKSDALLFLEREIDVKIEFNKEKERLKLLEKKDISDFDIAIARDTVEAFKNYLKKHPDGKFFGSAKSKINELNKRNYKNRLKQIITKSKSLSKVRLRSGNKKIGKNTIQEILRRIRVKNNFEIQTIEGDRVIIDYSTGLMWMVARYKLKFEKAKFWAVRHYAGYYNWRFPTVEEVFTLKKISPSYLQKNSLNNYRIWTGDRDIDSSNNWVFSLKEGMFSTSGAFNEHNLLSVRTIE